MSSALSRDDLSAEDRHPPVARERGRRILVAGMKMPSRLLIGLISAYQRSISPSLPALLGPGCGCRFYPTCSHYAADALRVHGAATGLLLAAWRLLRCNPFHRGGYDPVPAPGAFKRVCQRQPARQATL